MTPDERQQKINKFLEEGLNYYGLGKFPEAIDSWRKVLALDPDNSVARDYIESAGGETTEQSEARRPSPPVHVPPVPTAQVDIGSLIREAKSQIQTGSYEEAMDLLEQVLDVEPDNIEAQSFYEMSKGKQLKNYIREAGDISEVPTLAKGPGELMSYNLTKETGFILSLIDGNTTLDDIISLSGMDRFSAYRNIVILKRMGIIS